MIPASGRITACEINLGSKPSLSGRIIHHTRIRCFCIRRKNDAGIGPECGVGHALQESARDFIINAEASIDKLDEMRWSYRSIGVRGNHKHVNTQRGCGEIETKARSGICRVEVLIPTSSLITRIVDLQNLSWTQRAIINCQLIDRSQE